MLQGNDGKQTGLAQLAGVLEPIAGETGRIIFALGFFGAAVTVVVGGSPIQLIIGAQALTVVVASLLGILLVILANNRTLMGDLRNRWWQNTLSAIGVIAILATCYRLITTF